MTKFNKKLFGGIMAILIAVILVIPANVLAEELPSVRTNSASYIEGTTAVLRGYVNPRDTHDTVVWFEWGKEIPLRHSTVKINQGSQSQTVVFPIFNLEINTRYFYRIVAQNSVGIVYGSVQTFKTDRVEASVSKGHPIVITEEAVIHGGGSVVSLNGYVDTKGVRTRVWFQWGFTQDLGLTTDRSEEIRASGSFTESLTGLTPGTLYYYRAVASNDNGTSFGTILSVTSTAIMTNNLYAGASAGGVSPLAITQDAEIISSTKALLNAEAILGNSSVDSEGWFQWGMTSSLGSFTTPKSVYLGFSESLFGLSPNATYYYRAVVRNQYGIDEGAIFSFTTSSKKPSFVEPASATDTSVDRVEESKKENKKEIIDTDNHEVASVIVGFGSIFPQSFLSWILLTIFILLIILISRGYRITFFKKETKEQSKKD